MTPYFEYLAQFGHWTLILSVLLMVFISGVLLGVVWEKHSKTRW